MPENVSDANARDLVCLADLIVDCAPLFAERFGLERESVRQGKPMVAGFGAPLTRQMLVGNLREMIFWKLPLKRDPQCSECSGLYG